MHSKTYKWGIIGCGDVTEVKSGPAYQKTKGFQLHAVMRRNLALAEDYAKRHGVPKFYNDADALINDPEIDAVYIATPPDSHTAYALKVAEAGKICCIEKPMAPSFEECQLVTDTFAKKNIPLFIAYYRRSLPRFLQIKEWLDTNKIGALRHVSWHLSKPPSPIDLSGEANWRTDATIAYGGYFDDLASHGLDLICYFIGAIESAYGMATNQQNLYTGKDAVVGCWLHESGVTGSASWNFGANKREDRLEIYGEKGKITCSVFDEAPVQLEMGSQTESLYIENPNPIQEYHVLNMYKQLAEGIPHPSTGATATHVAWVMDAILGK